MRFRFIKEKRCVSLFFSIALITCLAVSALGQASDDRSMTGPLFRSTDGGASWTAINSGIVAKFVSAVAIDPVNTQIIYAGTDRGIFKSTDGGNNWIVPNGDITLYTIQAITIDPVTPSTLYAGTAGGGAYKSTDGGTTWRRINNGLQSLKDISNIINDPVDPSILYLGTRFSVFMTRDGGASWQEILEQIRGGDIVYEDDLALDPHNPSTVYAMGVDRLLKSTDGGQNWRDVSGPLTSLVAIAVDPIDSALYLLNDDLGIGLYKSLDAGNSYTRIRINTSTLPQLSVFKMAIDPVNTSNLYWATSRGVFKSTDGGINWAETGLSTTNGFPSFVNTLAINATNPSTVYAGTGGGVSPNDDSPWIRGVSVSGKKLIITGESFDDGAVILLDGKPQKTSNDTANPTGTLIGKKAGKRVSKNPETRIQIRNADGKLSQTVTRPVD